MQSLGFKVYEMLGRGRAHYISNVSDNTGNSSKTDIIIGVIAAVAVIAAVCVVLFLKKRIKKQIRNKNTR